MKIKTNKIYKIFAVITILTILFTTFGGFSITSANNEELFAIDEFANTYSDYDEPDYPIDKTESIIFEDSSQVYEHEYSTESQLPKDLEYPDTEPAYSESDDTYSDAEETAPPFIDLDLAPSARPYIIDLAKRGIVNGIGHDEFNPLGHVTREEFMRILFVALDIVDDNATSSFIDVDPNAWYHRYVATAEAIGLTKGIGDNMFGLGRNVTRQEIAVLLYRSFELQNISLYQRYERAEFLDDDDIFHYARPMVETLQMAGIISGFQDGTFGPNVPATRAQASVLIHRRISVQ